MLKIAVRKRALLETIDPTSLTAESLTSFAALAKLVLATRAGSPKTVTDIVPAIRALSQQYPDFTTPSATVRRMLVKNFFDIVLNKKLDYSRYHQNNLQILSLPPGTYFGTTATEGERLIQYTDATSNQHAGEIHVVFELGEVPGFEYAQLRQLFISNTDVLTKAAQKLIPEGAAAFGATLASLKRATLKIPDLTIISLRRDTPLRYNDIVGVVDFQTAPAGQFVPKRDFETFFSKMRDFFKDQKKVPDGPNAPKNFKLADLQNRTVVMIGVPPRGWSTDRFQSSLRMYNTTVTASMEYNTTYAFYDPNTQDQEKLNDARRRNIKMIPYNTVIALISAAVNIPR